MGLKFVDVGETLAKLDSLLRRNCAINSGLYFRNRCFASSIYKRSNIKRFSRVIEYVVGDGSGRFAENIAEDIIQFQVGYRQAVLCAVLLTGQHICEFHAVAD